MKSRPAYLRVKQGPVADVPILASVRSPDLAFVRSGLELCVAAVGGGGVPPGMRACDPNRPQHEQHEGDSHPCAPCEQPRHETGDGGHDGRDDLPPSP